MTTTIDYVAPPTLAEAVQLLSRHAGSRPLAGGQSLLPALRLGRATPGLLVDLRAVPDLVGIGLGPAGELRIGAMTTLDAIAASPEVRAHYPAVAEGIRMLADPLVRNRATIGGSLVGAALGADLPAIVLALDATIQVFGPAGYRTLSATELYGGVGPTVLGDAEIVTAISLPRPNPSASCAYEKMRNPASGYAICGVAAAIELSASGVIAGCGIAVAGVADRPVRLTRVAAALAGKPATAGSIASALDMVPGEGLTFAADLAASAEYRAHLTRVLAGRALTTAVRRAGSS